jgi:hypothetical protein
MQVIYNKKHTRIVEVAHFPIETLRSGKANEEGEVDSYYYMADWSEIKPSEEPERLSAFGASKDEIEIYCVKPYRALQRTRLRYIVSNLIELDFITIRQ